MKLNMKLNTKLNTKYSIRTLTLSSSLLFSVTSFGAVETYNPELGASKITAPIITVENRKAHIRAVYKEVNDNLPNYTEAVFDYLEPDATMGTYEIAYYDAHNKLRKTETTYYTELGERKLQYYLDDSKGDGLCFVFEQSYDYNTPIPIDNSGGNIQPSDINKATIKENRYYFIDNKMFEWIDNNDHKIVPNSEAFNQKQEVLLSDYYNVI